ncbi:hypothetical protein [Streptomyces sp. ISL-86]|uniref:hypothetical protein n=1 Tax=Streptomyces sp. ISL-86 TaxID=2819187 RepID=UPI001BE74CE7|nr:hypothetical protein [Streptomyces sp. ISL-86]MBT2454521.1 hypothetical protein [Streptomyces sp. ISL-86]
MGSGRERRQGTARLIAVCVVLLGLFLMHGAPDAAARGCHGEMAAPAAATTTAHGGHAHAPIGVSSAASGMHHPRATDDQAVAGAGEHGTLCVATAPRDRLPLPSVTLVMAAIALLSAWSLHRVWSLRRTGRRGPPGGRHLLLKVCIART